MTKTKKIALVVTLGLVIALAGFAAVVTALVRGADERPPQITAFAGGKSLEVAPAQYCNLYLEDCVESPVAELSVPRGKPLQISVPSDISDGLWRVVMVYQLDDGTVGLDERYHEPGESAAITVETPDGMQLNGIEIQLPSAVVNEQGQPLVHATWAIKTA
ncbi:DUF2771 domain-containing protein [Rhodococcus sp. NPDC058481]|uniref:DUF2771 domain-containing protein n=1 Tax=unclassified Rhodococcus (in: high G+C Gram-positive bacteria) TaxID=192944 RepID=UPI003667FAD1